jgi:excisionase family DNA binding protein
MTKKPDSRPAGPERLLTVKEYARIRDCSEKTVRRRIAEGKLPVIRTGRLVRKASAERQRDGEAEAVAEMCARLVGSEAILDRKTGERRACRPGDIALLAPTGSDLWRYEEALERRGMTRRATPRRQSSTASASASGMSPLRGRANSWFCPGSTSPPKGRPGSRFSICRLPSFRPSTSNISRRKSALLRPRPRIRRPAKSSLARPPRLPRAIAASSG